MKNGRIAGTGSYVPETIWKNEDLEKMVDTSDVWIRERTGIGARHIAGEETVAQMAVKAARRALENPAHKVSARFRATKQTYS